MNEPRYAIWGSAGHAKVLADVIVTLGGSVVALFDNRETHSVVAGVPLFIGSRGFEQWARSAATIEEIVGVTAIGGASGRDRLAILDRFEARGMRLEVTVHPSASVSPSAILKPGSQVLAQAVVAANARVGRGCIVNHKASVDHDCDLGDGVHLAPGATLCGCVEVGNNVFVGAGAVVLPRLSIGTDSIIGAGAVVTRSVDPGMVVAGNPARVVRKIAS